MTTFSKLQIPKIRYGYQTERKSSIAKIIVTCFNTKLYYEPWNPDIFMIRSIFRALEYSKV